MRLKFCRTIILIAILTLPLSSYYAGFGQRTIQDSLKAVVASNPNQDSVKVDQLNELAFKNFAYNVKHLHEYSEKALKLSQKLRYKKGEALAYRNLALSFMLIHGDVTALDYLNKSFRIFSTLKDTVNLAGVTNYMGCFYATVKDFKQALPYFLKAENLIHNKTHPIRLSILSNTGSCYEDLKQFDKAQTYYNRVKQLAENTGNYDWTVQSYYQSASMHIAHREYQKALNESNKAIVMTKSHEISPRATQAIYLLMGDIYYSLKEYGKSRKCYDNSITLSSQMKTRENLANIYFKFHLLDSIAGNYQLALGNFKKYQIITDSLINQNKNEIIALYKVKYDLREKEIENNLLTAAGEMDGKIITYQSMSLIIALISLAAIGFAFLRLKKLNNALQILNQKIVLQNSELEDVNGIKNKIFSVIAHDLRSPVGQLIGILDLLGGKMLSTRELDNVLPFLSNSVRQSMDTMDRLLIWSKSQLNGFTVNPENIDLNEMLMDTLDKLQSQIEEKNLTIVTGNFDRIKAFADKEMMRIVVRNLLSNAIKFTPGNGMIDVRSFTEGQFITMVFQDTGVGIDSDQLDKLFSFQVRSTHGTASETGSGLGLKICYDLLQLNKGQIRVESTIGKGSAFFVRIPAAE